MEQLIEQKSWVAIKDIASYCRVTRVTVRRWIKDGKIPAIKLSGGHYRIEESDFTTFLEGCQVLLAEDFISSSIGQAEWVRDRYASADGQ